MMPDTLWPLRIFIESQDGRTAAFRRGAPEPYSNIGRHSGQVYVLKEKTHKDALTTQQS